MVLLALRFRRGLQAPSARIFRITTAVRAWNTCGSGVGSPILYPLFVRESKKVRRAGFSFGRLIRMVGFLTLQGLWPLIRRIKWLTVFAVNAGRRDDVLAYCPSFLEGWFRKNRPVSPGGWAFTPGHMPSLVVVSPFSNDEFKRNPDLCIRVIESLKTLRARRIALNGVIPAALSLHGLWDRSDERFVRDQKGTVFMVLENVREIVRRHPKAFSLRPVVAVVGAGYTGARVARGLAEAGFNVMALDRRPEAEEESDFRGVRFVGRNTEFLSEVGLVVLLTGKGDDGVNTILPNVLPGTIVLSDTHPKVSKTKWAALVDKGIIPYESAAFRRGSVFFPALPRFKRDTLPGCVVQAFCEALAGRVPASQQEFNEMARAVSLEGRLDSPR